MALTQSSRFNRRSKDASVYPLMLASSFALLTDMVYTSSMLSVSIVTTGSIGISYMLWPAEFATVGRWFKPTFRTQGLSHRLADESPLSLSAPHK